MIRSFRTLTFANLPVSVALPYTDREETRDVAARPNRAERNDVVTLTAGVGARLYASRGEVVKADV